MAANIKVSGKVYNGIETISVKDTSDAQVRFSLQGTLPPEKSDVNFYDYDGALVASYTAADFANLSAMPANPSHTGLVAEGWNWTLADAKTYVANNRRLNIGQMYHTESGKSEFDVEINEETGFTATLTGTSGTQKDWGDGATDTLETHTYATAGNYVIKLSESYLPSLQNSKKVRAVRIASGVTSIEYGGFAQCHLLKYVTIPLSVTTFDAGGDIFSDCFSLKHITIPISVIEIAANMFYQCFFLQTIALPKNITSIGFSSFGRCALFQSITIPEGVTTVGSYTFYECSSLREVIIPSSVTEIQGGAFDSCTWLTIVTVLATTPPTVASYSFPSNVTTIYIPYGTLATYQADTNWSTYASKLVELPA